MGDTNTSRRRVLLTVLVVVATIGAFLPALDVYLAGDDFEWLDASYDIASDPLSSFELINRFFRPLVKWTYLADYLIFRQAGFGYMVTNLLIHLVNALLLALLLKRRLAPPEIGVYAAAAFALSPLHSEAVLWAAGRPETVLLTCWLGALLLLDRWGKHRSQRLLVAFTAVSLLGVGAKESWIVFPFIATAYVVLVLGERILTALRVTSILWAVWFSYVAFFLIRPMLSGTESAMHYADFGVFPAIAKTSTTVIAFCGFGWVGFEGATAVALAALVVAVTTAWLIQTDNRFGLWALIMMGATLFLVAPFPVAVLRHNYLPLAGFWMLVAAIVLRLLTEPNAVGWRSSSARRWAAATAAAILVVEGAFLQREIDDYRLYGDLHLRLCQSYAGIEGQIDRGDPFALVDRGTLRAVDSVIDRVRGVDKTFFVRRDALWQLVFLPSLANFVGHPFDERLLRVDVIATDDLPARFAVVVFDDDGFHLRPDLAAAILAAADKTGDLPPGVSFYRFIGSAGRRSGGPASSPG
jgi:hypothetical protein